VNVELLKRPGSSAAKITLAGGETVTTEGGSMIAMSGDMQIETTTQQKSGGGLFSAAKRLLSGESFFLNKYTAGMAGGEVWLGTSLVGDMVELGLTGKNIIAQGGSFVACEPSVTIDLGWQGLKSLFSGERIFWLHLSGQGKVVLNSFGAIYAVEVEDSFIVDTGHIVAFEEGLEFTISKAGGSWISSFLGGEGFVCKFNGKGTIWCQSHNPSSFGKLLGPLLPER
jgi:uncharacterized protein (TIGR00266 family)